MNAAPNSTIEWPFLAATGLTPDVQIVDNQGAVTLAPSTDDIIETPAGTGVYAATRTAPSSAGTYTLVATDGAGATLAIEPLNVTFTALAGDAPAGRDLCTVSDVTSYLPGYKGNDTTDAKLQQLITAESQLIHDEAGREIMSAPGLAGRLFELGPNRCRRRNGHVDVDIGDLATLDDVTVEIVDRAGTVTATVDAGDYQGLYQGHLQPGNEWEPVTALRLHTAAPAGGLLRVTGQWGFPQVPAFIREATAKRVILRYVSDVANEGTQLSDSVDNLQLAAMFASARDAIDDLRTQGVWMS